MKTVGEEAPELLVAHAYTRYLGDLSGGQQLARVARKAYNLEKGGAGTAFYEFGNIENFNRFKKGYVTMMTHPFRGFFLGGKMRTLVGSAHPHQVLLSVR